MKVIETNLDDDRFKVVADVVAANVDVVVVVVVVVMYFASIDRICNERTLSLDKTFETSWGRPQMRSSIL